MSEKRLTMLVKEIAIVCHEANRIYCQQIGDNSHLSWSEAKQWQRDSIIEGVMFVIANPSALASSNHDNWLLKKEADGWKYGLVKNEATKEHPCCIPYEGLPIEQKRKDYLFVGIVKALMGLKNE